MIRRASFTLLGLMCLTARASAQSAPRAHVAACVDSIPAREFQRTLVYLTPRGNAPPGDALVARAEEVGLFAQSVSFRTRELLGGAADRAVDAGPTLSWRDLGTEVEVEVLPDGAYRWRVGENTELLRRGTAGAALLGRAIDSLIAENESFFRVDAAIADTVRFRLAFQTPVRHADGTVSQLRLPVAFPVFTVLDPWSEPVHIAEVPKRRTPGNTWQRLKSMSIELSFIVDTTGHVVAGSTEVRNVSIKPDGAPKSFVDEQLDAARESAESTRYVPARLGGCLVPELVRLVRAAESSSYRLPTPR